jgi:predicted metal-dependent HD superfamily phosphohydrolase
MFDFKPLDRVLVALGLKEDDKLFRFLDAAYSSPDRHYHSGTHISECLKQFAMLKHLADRPAEVEFAIWFHDAVYDTHQSDNEEQSAVLASSYLVKNDVHVDVVKRVEEMIVATKNHGSTTSDGALLLDVDLGILGTSSDVFERYDAQIRKEYEWIPLSDYKRGRAEILKSFLNRDAIFTTEYFQENYEARARSNLKRKIEELEMNRGSQ